VLQTVERIDLNFMSAGAANAAADKLIVVGTRLENASPNNKEFLENRAQQALIANAALTPDRMIVFGRTRANAGKMMDTTLARII
ncbi:hypothetical protein, partial [Stenotrophomonas maltophilia]|uniref:hypothetical protein n=1 Tax=Stenotrophomonas maltophilia TaxID=40324 RepID=UPI0013D95295